MPPLLRYVVAAVLNVAYLALVCWLVAFATVYLNPFTYDSLHWNAPGNPHSTLTAARAAAVAIALAEGWALLLLAYPVNKYLLRPTTPSAARWAFAAGGAVVGLMVSCI